MTIETSQLFNRSQDSDFSSDSEQENRATVCNFTRGSRAVALERQHRRDQIIAEINGKIERGEPLDLSQYPPIYVVHFRGVHFLKVFLHKFKEEKKDEKSCNERLWKDFIVLLFMN